MLDEYVNIAYQTWCLRIDVEINVCDLQCTFRARSVKSRYSVLYERSEEGQEES